MSFPLTDMTVTKMRVSMLCHGIENTADVLLSTVSHVSTNSLSLHTHRFDHSEGSANVLNPIRILFLHRQ